MRASGAKPSAASSRSSATWRSQSSWTPRRSWTATRCSPCGSACSSIGIEQSGTPRAPHVAQYLADLELDAGLPDGVVTGLPEAPASSDALIAIRRLGTYNDVEDVSGQAMALLHEQAMSLAVWGEPVHMAVSELCDNALQHGRNSLGTHVAADRVDAETSKFRLAVADLGIGIPEHIRERHPEWQDDTAAIVRALQRGVTGTGDPHRGNGFAEVVEDVNRTLVPARSSVNIRGMWITYTVTTIPS